jgi:hypothetical protein
MTAEMAHWYDMPYATPSPSVTTFLAGICTNLMHGETNLWGLISSKYLTFSQYMWNIKYI